MFQDVNLYNAARLAGRVSFKVTHVMKSGALILKPARDGQPGEIDREQEKTCQPRYIYDQTSHHCLRFHPSSRVWRIFICWCRCPVMDT